MSKRGRIWIPVDVDYFDCPEVEQAGIPAAWTYLRLVAYSKRHLTDGMVPTRTARSLGCHGDVLDALVAVGLLAVGEVYVTILAYGGWNPMKGQVKAANQAHAERTRRYRERLKTQTHHALEVRSDRDRDRDRGDAYVTRHEKRHAPEELRGMRLIEAMIREDEEEARRNGHPT